MAHNIKYGKLDIPGIGEDEPVFVIRAKDEISVIAIEQYRDAYFDEAQVVGLENTDAEGFMDRVDKVVAAFESWRLKNKNLIKLPD